MSLVCHEEGEDGMGAPGKVDDVLSCPEQTIRHPSAKCIRANPNWIYV